MKSPIRLTKDYAHTLLSQVDNFLFDCDGVVWNWPKAIPGAVEFIKCIKNAGKRCYFVTNNSTKTRGMLLDMIQKLGIEGATEDDIVCTSWVLAGYLKTRKFTDKVYVVGNPSMGKELDAAGIRHVGIGSTAERFPDPFSIDYKRDITFDPEVKCVAVGFDHYFSYPKMVMATSYAHMPGVEFIATNEDAVFPSGSDSNVVIPGTGTFVKALQTSIGREPIILGKPHRVMWDVLSQLHQLDPNRTCMVGDRLDTDIAFAYNCGIKYSLAVLSGITNEQEILNYASKSSSNEVNNNNEDHKCVPDFYAESLGEFEQFLSA